MAVVGAGVVGLSIAAGLRDRVDVRCFERLPSAMGERSAGSSRIFRLAHARPELVELARSALAAFRRWEEAAGAPMIRPTGCVVSGSHAVEWAAAMQAAGAPCEVRAADGAALRLPATSPPAHALVDPAGGVIDVGAVRAYLLARTRDVLRHDPVHALEADPAGATVWTAAGRSRFDVVVLAAGAGTSPLAAQVGIYTPCALVHHVRFGFPAARADDWMCWIDDPAGGLTTYQHRTGPGVWSVGGSLDPAQVAWEVGPDAAAAASRDAVLRHVREHLAVEPRVVDSLYCTTTTPGLGDGFRVRRSGPVLAVYGSNLFKLAPVVGETLAAAALDGSTPSVAEFAAS